MAGTAEISDESGTGNEFVDLADDVDELDREREEPGEEEDADGDEEESSEESKDEEGEAAEDGGDADDDDGAREEEGEGDEEPEDAGDKTADEIKSLRQVVRAQRSQLKELEGKLEKHTEALKDKDIIADDELGDGKEAEEAAAAHSELLDQMVELMELNPKFEDVREVCSQANFDDVSELLAKAYVAEHGGEVDEVADQIAASVWAKTNPYKEMYGLVKTYHPDFAEKKSESKGDVLEKAKVTKKAAKKDAAPSLSNMPGGSGGGKSAGAGWTSARIDQLSEDELSKVPADVYEAYMTGELD